jgi:predicted NBD/HSP70 family sugar kinase
MPSGFAAETVARLAALDLVEERPAPPTGGRGRPTTVLHPHPCGPLVAIAAIAHETWQVAAMQIGGAQVVSSTGTHQRDLGVVLGALSKELSALDDAYGERIRAVAVAVPGTVTGSRLVQAPNLGWSDVDLSVLWSRYDPDRPFLVGNDATFSAVAESLRGAARGAGTALHLYMDAGVGGAVIEGGRVLVGASGMAGEFGHMPFGDPQRQCRCGAPGCWNTSLDGLALARALAHPAPADEVSYTRAVMRAAQDGKAPELDAVHTLARCLGRGAAGLVNAFDPHIVTVGGLGQDLLRVAGHEMSAAYRGGLMRFRSSPPPPLAGAQLGPDAPLVGAGEEAFARILTDTGLRAWTSSRAASAS